MTESVIVHTDLIDQDAGLLLGQQIHDRMPGAPPDALIVFASPRNDYSALLEALNSACQPKVLVGCSSAGEFTSEVSGEGLTCAIALRSPGMQFHGSITRGLRLSNDRSASAQQLVAGFKGSKTHEFRHRAALILVDALAGYAEELVEGMTVATAGTYRFFGGGAGDDARFKNTHVFFGTEAHSDAAVALEILSNKALGIGARHGWQPAGSPMRVTAADDACVVSLNVAPAVEAFEEFAADTRQTFDRDDPIPFFLHNIVGIQTDAGHKLRVPLGVGPNGGIVCAAEVPVGSTAHIMAIGAASSAEAAANAAQDAVQQVRNDGNQPGVALFFDCVATRLRLGKAFGGELESLAHELGTTQFAGFNSYGQIVRAEGQFSGFHNCTAVVCVIPE